MSYFSRSSLWKVIFHYYAYQLPVTVEPYALHYSRYIVLHSGLFLLISWSSLLLSILIPWWWSHWDLSVWHGLLILGVTLYWIKPSFWLLWNPSVFLFIVYALGDLRNPYPFWDYKSFQNHILFTFTVCLSHLDLITVYFAYSICKTNW